MNYINSSTITDINVIPILHECSSFFLEDNEINFIRNGTKYDGTAVHRKNQLSKNKNILENKNLSRVKNFINDRMLNYIENVAQIENEFYMTQSWSTISKKDQNHHVHTHPNAIFSCVYYAQCESGDIEFYFEPRLREKFNFTYKIKKWNNFNCETWNYEVKTGDIIIFPAWIPHGTTPNDIETDRIIIGANYFIKGKVGEYDDTDLIEI